MSKNSNINLNKSLWNAADVLRRKMDISEYKNYLLGLIFYRFLSMKSLQAFAESTGIQDQDIQIIKDAYEKYLSANDDTSKFIYNSLLSKVGYYIKPKYLYSNLIAEINYGNFELEDLENALHELEVSTNGQTSQSNFEGLFDDVNLKSNKLGGNLRQRKQVISNIMVALNDIDLLGHNGDLLGDAYEYLISQVASDSGKKASEFYTPRQVSDIISQIVTYKPDAGDNQIRTIYDPAVGSGSLMLNVGQHVQDPSLIQYHGQELNPTTYNLARMNLMLHNVSYKNMELRNMDTLNKDCSFEESYQFDAVSTVPPISAHWNNSDSRLSDPRFKDYGVLPPKSKADYAFLLDGLYHLKEDGTMGIVLPHGVLFRGAKEGKIRQKLIEDNRIDAVIGLPANIFHSTSIPTLIMVLKKDKDNSDVMFIDASREFEKGKNQNNITSGNIAKIVKTYKEHQDVDKYAHVASYDEIKENDFNLNIPRYVDTFEPEPDIDIDEVFNNINDIDQRLNKNMKIIKEMYSELKYDNSKSPKLRFNQFNDSWMKYKLSQLGTVDPGKNFPKFEQSEQKNGYPFFKISDMSIPGNEDIMKKASNNFDKSYIRKKEWKLINPRNDAIIFANRGGSLSTKNKKLVKQPFFIYSNLMAYEFNSKWNSYFGLSLLRNTNFSAKQIRGMFSSISSKDVKDIEVFIPSIKEQDKIGYLFYYLDNFNNLQNEKSKLIDKMKDGFMQKMFINK